MNSAIAALSVNKNEEAKQIMEGVQAATPVAEYVRSMTSARFGDTANFYNHIVNAVTDSKLHNRAKTEVDFLPYHNEPRFINIVTNDKEN